MVSLWKAHGPPTVRAIHMIGYLVWIAEIPWTIQFRRGHTVCCFAGNSHVAWTMHAQALTSRLPAKAQISLLVQPGSIEARL
jgi:hypothetical protein